MKKIYFLLMLFLIPLTTKAYNIKEIINILTIVESNGDSCAIGDNGKAYGILQIHNICVKDVNRIYNTNYIHQDVFSIKKSFDIFELYINHGINLFYNKYHYYPTDIEIARMWNGGIYNGYKSNSTLIYAKKYKKEKNNYYKNFSPVNLELNIYQDAKLAFFKDNYNNNPFTLDTTIEVALYFQDDTFFKSFWGINYEHALLYSGKYRRISGEIGEYIFLNHKRTIRMGLGINLAYTIKNTNIGTLNIGSTAETTFIIDRHLLLQLQGDFSPRPDLPTKWATFSGKIGLGYRFDNKYDKIYYIF